MENNRSPVCFTDGDKLVTELFKKVRLAQPANSLADEVVEFGRRRRWMLSKKPHHGTVDGIVRHGALEYRVLQSDDTIPEVARKRLEEIKAEFPVKQVLIGEETEPSSVDKFETALLRIAEAAKTTVRAVFVAVGLALAAVTAISAIAAVVMAGALVVGTAAVAAAVDPELVVVLDDPEEEAWVLCARWYD